MFAKTTDGQPLTEDQARGLYAHINNLRPVEAMPGQFKAYRVPFGTKPVEQFLGKYPVKQFHMVFLGVLLPDHVMDHTIKPVPMQFQDNQGRILSTAYADLLYGATPEDMGDHLKEQVVKCFQQRRAADREREDKEYDQRLSDQVSDEGAEAVLRGLGESDQGKGDDPLVETRRTERAGSRTGVTLGDSQERAPEGSVLAELLKRIDYAVEMIDSTRESCEKEHDNAVERVKCAPTTEGVGGVSFAAFDNLTRIVKDVRLIAERL